jgi:hypothetical protein
MPASRSSAQDRSRVADSDALLASSSYPDVKAAVCICLDAAEHLAVFHWSSPCATAASSKQTEFVSAQLWKVEKKCHRHNNGERVHPVSRWQILSSEFLILNSTREEAPFGLPRTNMVQRLCTLRLR